MLLKGRRLQQLNMQLVQMLFIKQPVVLVLALTVILQWAQTFATLGGQYVGIVCSIALYAITAYALLRRSIGLALQQALCFFLLTDCTDTIMRFANMRLLGYDPLRSGTFWAALLAYLPLTTVQGTLLWLLRSFCPAEKLRILRSSSWSRLDAFSVYPIRT